MVYRIVQKLQHLNEKIKLKKKKVNDVNLAVLTPGPWGQSSWSSKISSSL